jgi:hypothetical protein
MHSSECSWSSLKRFPPRGSSWSPGLEHQRPSILPDALHKQMKQADSSSQTLPRRKQGIGEEEPGNERDEGHESLGCAFRGQNRFA